MAYHYQREIHIQATPEKVFDFHTQHENLLRITPPGIKVSIIHAEPTGIGAVMRMRVKQFGLIANVWQIEFTGYERPSFLRDEMRIGPFKQWVQERHIIPTGEGTILRDIVHYDVPLGFLGAIAHTLFIRRQIEAMFLYRQQKTKELLEHAI